MGFLNVNVDEVEAEVNRKGFTLPEPKVYPAKIKSVYIDKTDGGTSFVNFVMESGKFPDDVQINVEGWDVNRMIKNKEGSTVMKNGRMFNGIILLGKLCKATGVEINSLEPVVVSREIRDEMKQVGALKDFDGKEVYVGIRHKETEWEGNIYTKLVIVDFLSLDATEDDIEKLSKAIEKKPVVKEKNKDDKSSSKKNDDIPKF